MLPSLNSLGGLVSRILTATPLNKEFVRFAAKKAKTSTKWFRQNTRPKHRGLKKNDGAYVQQGTLLVLQRTLRFHPGLNVGFGRNGTLFAMVQGRVAVTCEAFDPNWTIDWVVRTYAERKGDLIYKKYLNVIPEEQHTNFNLIDQV